MVILFREGPIPPDLDDITEILRSLSPDAMEDNASMLGYPIPDWPTSDSEEMIYLVRREIESNYRKGMLPLGRKTSQVMYFTKDDLRHVLVKLLMDPEESQALFAVLTQRIQVAVEENQGDPRAVATEPFLRRCVETPLLRITMKMISNLSLQAAQDGKPKYYVDRFEDIALVIYVMPTLNDTVAREDLNDDFGRNAKKYVEMLGVDPNQINIAYWMIHTGEGRQQIYFSFFPHSTDLLPARGVGMPSVNSLNLDWGYVYWFDWTKISDSGEPRYGEYVFRQILPFFMPESPLHAHSTFFFDGDVDPEENTQIMPLDEKDNQCLDKVRSCGISNCYAIGVLADKKTLVKIDQELSSSTMEAYLGRLSWRGQGIRDFIELTDKLGLDFIAHISDQIFEKNDFGYMSDDELLQMGFLPSEFNE